MTNQPGYHLVLRGRDVFEIINQEIARQIVAEGVAHIASTAAGPATLHVLEQQLPQQIRRVNYRLPLLAVDRRTFLLGRENVMAGTDCGFSQGAFNPRVHLTIMSAKLEALAEGAALASRQLWG